MIINEIKIQALDVRASSKFDKLKIVTALLVRWPCVGNDWSGRWIDSRRPYPAKESGSPAEISSFAWI